jgi:hypothetical protein
MKLGLVPVISYKDPSVAEATGEYAELLKDSLWIAQTAVKVPTLKTKVAGREIPKLSVKMKYLQATGPTREQAIAKLREEILSGTRGIPELHAEDIEV